MSIALLHEPVLDRRGRRVTAAITSLDIHDLARTARTYGVQTVYVVHPVEEQREFALRVRDHWFESQGRQFDSRRREALELVRVVASLEEAVGSIEQQCHRRPLLVYTSARTRAGVSYRDLRNRVHAGDAPVLLLFGTGFGLGPEVAELADLKLQPIFGAGNYNHLPVRAAVAIVLDRLLAGDAAQ